MDNLIPHGKYKQRSHETSRERHTVELQNNPTGPSVVLLGDSMIERMVTTGLSPSFDPWPSTTLISDETIRQQPQVSSASPGRIQGVFNAGVGGDKFENVIYRLTGSSDPVKPLNGLLDALRNRDVKLWVLHVGTNNLHPKRGMRKSDLVLLRLVVEALLETNGKILLVGLFRRKDIKDELVAKANESYVELVRQFQENGSSRIEFLEPPLVDIDECLEDHVHLNERVCFSSLKTTERQTPPVVLMDRFTNTRISLKKIFARSKHHDSINEKTPTTYDIKVAVAAYSIQRRVLETLHRTLLAELRQAHDTELENFKEDFKEDLCLQASISQTTRSMFSKTSSTSSNEESITSNKRNLPANGRIHRRMEVTKVQLLQAKERRAAGKQRKDEMHGLRKEHGDIVIPERNGGITEADCLREINTILVDWGLTNVKLEGETNRWEKDLENMVSYHVQREQEERKRRREARSVY
ncbi:hypothetical protein CFIO01_02270 [Colletotrichum fioriniae PJ7]|uniref:SGNH hydrolase-type esterase domain-containing protein n=1 Tax=Colletotrichum fioriniae PJ7 TaxID=1445577 RepID=A0A010RZY4_9PEZI|nr:hypothetical protein CFIO01_02270 [Colletotrichum fioriniae PJ7]